jgi:DNA processing protein
MVANHLPSLDELADVFVLEAIKGFGPQKFKELREDRIAVSDVLSRPREMQRFGKRGEDFRKQLATLGRKGRLEALSRAKRQLEVAQSADGTILTYDDRRYPRVLYDSNIPVPVLYARGDLNVLNYHKAVACVGSRKIRPPYSELHDAFARHAVSRGYVVVSGFATGADIIGHLAAEAVKGKTVCVMPSGLDRPFPPEHKNIWLRFISKRGAVFVSEFGFGVGASALSLRKRNKMIAGMAGGVLVTQSAEDGGAMNAFRFAVEQKKPVATFRSDSTRETSGNELIAGSAEKVKSTVLEIDDRQGWTTWLHTL